VSPEVYRTNLTAGSIAGLVGGLLFGLILLILSLVLCRPRRTQHNKQVKADIGNLYKILPPSSYIEYININTFAKLLTINLLTF
jgi:hypothetical protein